LKAQAFEASIAPEPAAESAAPPSTPPPKANRAGLQTILTLLVVALVGVMGFFIFHKSSGGMAKVPAATNAMAVAKNLLPTSAGGSLHFGGQLGHLTIVTTGALTGTFTVECWALNRAPKQGGTILSSRTPDEYGMDIKFRQGKRFHSDIGDGARWVLKNANATYAYQGDTWYHLAYVVTANHYSIYVNGRLTGDREIYPAGNPLLYDATHHLRLGIDRLDEDDLDGNIAELRIWRTARTQAQIESNLNQSLKGDEPGLMGNWRFTEGSGVVVEDSSGHGFNGTLMGKVSWSSETPLGFHR
jgi:hypothetical protein